MSDAPPPGGYPPQQPPQQPPPGGYPPQQPPQQPPPGGYGQPSYPPPQQPPQPPSYPPPAPGYQPPAGAPPTYQAPPTAPGYATAPPGQYAGGPPAGPAPKSSNSGCIKALIIGIIVVVVLGIASTVGFVLLVSNAVDKTFGPADKNDYSVQDLQCQVESFGSLTATGKITNKADHKQAYTLTVVFTDGSTKLGEDSAIFTGELSAGQTSAFTGTEFITGTPPDQIQCQVTEVSYSPI